MTTRSRSHLYFPVRGGERALNGLAVLQHDIYRRGGRYRLNLIPGCGENAETIGPYNEALAILFDNATGDAVAVLQHYLAQPRRS